MIWRTNGVVCALVLGIGALGCSEKDEASPPPSQSETTIPQQLTAVASEGFMRPSDAVSSHDGQMFYFIGVRPGTDGDPDEAAVFSVASTGGAVTPLHVGAPLGNPTGLVMACDSATLYVADLGQALDEEAEAPATEGAVFAVDAASGALSALQATGISRASGMALSDDCTTLYVTGWTMAGEPAVFTVAVGGGAAQVLLAGEPLVSPTGIHVDKDGVAWVMDHLAEGQNGSGVLFAVASDGVATEVISDLRMGTPGGVSLDSTGATAVMPTLNDEGQGQLTTVQLATGDVVHVAAPMMRDPAGLRTARNAPIFAVVDSESHTIYAAQ